MPILVDRDLSPDCRLAVWEITEQLEDLLETADLTDADRDRVNSFYSRLRRLQYIAVRQLLRGTIGSGSPVLLEYDSFGKPHLVNSVSHISLSHTSRFVSLLVSRGECGVDIEKISSRIWDLSEKFLSENERNFLGDDHRLEKLHVIWGAKEALYKLYGRKELIFKEDLLVQPFDYSSGSLTGLIRKLPVEKTVPLAFEKVDNHMLVYTLG